jgi:uncharacterized membrane protein
VSLELEDPLERACTQEDLIESSHELSSNWSAATKSHDWFLGGLGLIVVLAIVGLSVYFAVRYLL